MPGKKQKVDRAKPPGSRSVSTTNDEAEDLALRRQAEAIAPSRERLDVLIDNPPPSSVCYDDEDDEPPC